tara:strand:+ start:377 stop:646 length:270 start_codon:yes stop_codon:yes gene_type:complete
MLLSEEKLIEYINNMYPQAKATPLSEFYDDDSRVGIWFRGSEDYLDDDRLVFDYYNSNYQCHPSILGILHGAGWDFEPYDSGTMMAYPN